MAITPESLTVDDVDWPSWLIATPMVYDDVGGMDSPGPVTVDPMERAAEIVALAKIDPETWDFLQPYLKKDAD